MGREELVEKKEWAERGYYIDRSKDVFLFLISWREYPPLLSNNITRVLLT
jgi:hypothetical protein